MIVEGFLLVPFSSCLVSRILGGRYPRELVFIYVGPGQSEGLSIILQGQKW